jgi:CDGSH-type Zn-finger protein
MLYNNKEGRFYEPKFDPAISLIEDSIIKISGPIWVKGGIRIESSDGTNYEIRNRVTLCRCGKSKNKPFCDSSHVFSNFNDHLMEKEEMKTEILVEEDVY